MRYLFIALLFLTSCASWEPRAFNCTVTKNTPDGEQKDFWFLRSDSSSDAESSTKIFDPDAKKVECEDM